MTQNFDRIYIGIFAVLAVVALIKFFKEPNVANFSIFILTVFGSYLTVKDLNDTSQKLNYLKKLADINDTITKNIDSLNRVNNDLSGKIKAAVDASNELSNKIYSVTGNIQIIDSANHAILKSVHSLQKINRDIANNIDSVVNKTQGISSTISRTTDTLNKFANGGDSYPFFYIDPQIGYLNRYVKTVGIYPLNGVVVKVYDLNKSKLVYYSFQFEDTINTKLFDVPVVTVPHLLDRFYYPFSLINERTFAFQIRITTQKGEYDEFYAVRFRDKIFKHISKITSFSDYKSIYDTVGTFLNKGETAQYFFDHIRDSSYLNKHVYPFPQLNENGVIP